jgi:hypothetical protein
MANRYLIGMAGNTCIYPTPYEFTADHRAGSLGHAKSPDYSFHAVFPLPATVRSAVEHRESRQQGPLIRLVRLVRTFSNERSHHWGARSPGCPASQGIHGFHPRPAIFHLNSYAEKRRGSSTPTTPNEGAAIYANLSTLTKQRTYSLPSGHQALHTLAGAAAKGVLFVPSTLRSVIPNAESIHAETPQEET